MVYPEHPEYSVSQEARVGPEDLAMAQSPLVGEDLEAMVAIASLKDTLAETVARAVKAVKADLVRMAVPEAMAVTVAMADLMPTAETVAMAVMVAMAAPAAMADKEAWAAMAVPEALATDKVEMAEKAEKAVL